MICSSPCVFLFFSSSFRFVSFLALSLSFGSYMWMCALVGALRLLAASLSRFTFLIDTALHILIELQCGSECIFSLHNNTYVHRVYVLCVSCCCCRRCCCCCFFRFIPFLLLTSFFSSSLDFFLGLSWRCMCSELRKKGTHSHASNVRDSGDRLERREKTLLLRENRSKDVFASVQTICVLNGQELDTLSFKQTDYVGKCRHFKSIEMVLSSMLWPKS